MTDTTIVDPNVNPQLPLTPAEPVATDPPAVTPEPVPAVNPKSPKWALDRISEESQGRRAAEEKAADLARRLEAAEAMLSRAPQNPQNPAPQPQLRQPVAPPTPQPPRAEIAAEAQRQRFMEDMNEIVVKGLSQYGNDSFTGTVSTLTALGANDEFLADVVAVDKANAHVLFQKIAGEPERARALMLMNPRQRIAAIVRDFMPKTDDPKAADPKPADPKPEPAKVSKAPTPPPPVQHAATEVKTKNWWDDDVDGADCDAIFFGKERLERRAGRRR